MPTCSTCESSYNDAARFCPRCGSLGQPSKPFLYSGSIVLGVALFFMVLLWRVGSLAPTAVTTPTPTPEPPDDVAILISHCGQPDSDKGASDSQTRAITRSLLYRKARVTAVFIHAEGSSRWKVKNVLDLRTLNPLTGKKLTTRLPCLYGTGNAARKP
jgi:hypothetical protein